MNSKDVTICGVLTALALALSFLERLVPIGFILPLPGVKLGLSNIVILYAILKIGRKQAFFITLLKILLLLWFSGNASAFAMSASGGLLSFGAMALAAPYYQRYFSIWGISVLGAVFHNIGQVVAAMVVAGTPGFFHLLAPLMVSALLFGTICAAVTRIITEKLTNP